MSAQFWHKQGNEPLYKDLLWDKPENKQHAGKLLIIGGNLHSFAAPGAAYQAAIASGIGIAKVLLPDALKKTVGSFLENGEFAPSNKSGSFSRKALSDWLDFAMWADGVLIPGDMGRNSETAIVLEQFVSKYTGQLTITQDALDYFTANPEHLLKRPETTLVTSFAQLQKLGVSSHFMHAFVYDVPIATMVENLHLFTTLHAVNIILRHNGILYVARDGEVATTKVEPGEATWRVETASHAAVWTLQNPSKVFAALCCTTYELSKETS